MSRTLVALGALSAVSGQAIAQEPGPFKVQSALGAGLLAGYDRFELRLRGVSGAPFPPGRRFAPSRFWTASPSTQDSHPTSMPAHGSAGLRPAADFVASGEAAMLAWSPPQGAARVNPVADTMSLVRLLGGLGAKDFPPGADVTSGDVVNRSTVTGRLNPIRWDLVWSRLDPYVRNGSPNAVPPRLTPVPRAM